MKILLDLNVLLDVLQAREPYFQASARIISNCLRGDLNGFIPAHAVTTVQCVLRKLKGASESLKAVDWLLHHFDVCPIGKPELARARSLQLKDFEDGVVASAAVSSKCKFILTRNISDYKGSPIAALSPEQFLSR